MTKDMTADEIIAFTEFLTAYRECALWASTDDEGQPLDDEFDVLDFAPEAIIQTETDARDFYDANRDDIDAHMTAAQAGHDFWLTRNHHGAGFWGRGLPADVSKRLTRNSHAYGSCDLYVGDDGLVYVQ